MLTSSVAQPRSTWRSGTGPRIPQKSWGSTKSTTWRSCASTPNTCPVAPLGNSDDLLIGEWAIAIGNPYGFFLGNTEPSVTAGVISGTGRNLVGQAEGNGVYVDMIQTDAAINPGNSGGPLVNALGEVIGVNSSIYTPSGGSVGLGFAIPINRAKRVTEDLLAHGAVRRPWIGVQPQLSESSNPREVLTGGVTVRSVAPGSPAARAGIVPGDMIVQSRGRPMHNPYDWEAELLDMRVGENVRALDPARRSRVHRHRAGRPTCRTLRHPRSRFSRSCNSLR